MSGTAPAFETIRKDEFQREQQRKRAKFAITPLSEIVIDDVESEFLVEDIMPLRGLATIFGPPGSAKTFLALDLALCVAAGLPFFGKPVSQGGVLYIAAEAGAGLKKRVIAARAEKAMPDSAPFAMIALAPNLGPKKSEAAALIADIRGQWPYAPPVRLIIVDTLARTLRGDENSSVDMAAFVDNAATIGAAFNCLVLVVHHSGKDAERGMRGSSNLNGATDCEWQISSKDAIRTVMLHKMKDGEDRLEWSFRLEQRQVSGISGKRSRSTCVVVPETLPKPAQPKPTRPHPGGLRKLVLESVYDALGTYGEIMPVYPDLPRGKGVNRKYVKENAALRGVGNAENPKSQSSLINKELGHLNADGWIRQWGDWIWLPD
ncbi:MULTISPECIES: AAA family ATPase [unclassified Rhizobium]|uniref:AAA family ATPase n=1 Tax=unclassified Rhizobium TaxID=2613769 RepID=UPI0007EAF390|nr:MULTISPECIES: helicase RepA family protein [unclassified Rhizobium]ANK84165.1 AAA domain-containing protein [Rhizobium sp. N731]ANL14413.1 AAA domain-containing protein [Rhizobium sp. N1314]